MLRSSLIAPAARSLAALGLLLLTGGSGAFADDRDLLRESSGEPYVFILLDTSGSMNWTPKCTAAQVAAGECQIACEFGDCFARLQADDPGSKFYQAKEALYEVLKGINDVQFGIATYNQDELSMRAKHWIYRVRENGVTLPGSGGTASIRFPAAGAEEVIGYLWSCDTGGGDHEIGCDDDTPADTADSWELARIRRLPKGGRTFNQNVTIYVRHANTKYRVIYTPTGGGLPGDSTLRMTVRVDRCDNSSCSNRTLVGEPTLNFDLATNSLGQPAEFASWDNGGNSLIRTPTKQNPSVSYFSQSASSDSSTDVNTICDGWDPNTDTNVDPGPNSGSNPKVNLRWPTTTGDPRGSLFHTGDVIPLDWQTDHNLDIRRRLAPNTVLDPTATPDFRISSYFKNQPDGSESFLRLKDDRARPFLANGSTPLGNSIKSFRTWYAGCANGNCPKGTGWKHTAAAQDPNWGCRKKFLLILTDGDDTCGGADACSGTAALNAQEGILTYVVAFGVENTSGNRLNCMAANGGTKNPIYPQNKQELINALTEIFGQIREQAAAFASAAVPTVQAEAADKIYVSNFTPLNGEPVWDGHIHSFLKPLPRTADGRPDTSVVCPPEGDPDRGSCHLWDAAVEIQKQAPEMAALGPLSGITATQLRLGLNANQRRVFYALADDGAVPRDLRFFAPPPGAPPAGTPAAGDLWIDLFDGLRLPSSPASVRTTSATRARSIIAETLTLKHSTVQTASGGTQPVTYLLGDTFHADPVIADRPSDFMSASHNLFTQGDDCTEGVGSDTGYRCFADKYRRRRKMLVVGSNDGQLHFFDAGTWQPDQPGKPGHFSDGTGTELFSYIPRLSLPLVRDLSEQSSHIFGLDSTPRVEDVFIDPLHNGTPTADDRQWRTVVIGGFREGGDPIGGSRMTDFVSGYYALDITQPDPIEKTQEEGIGPDGLPRQVKWEPETNDAWRPGCLTDNGSVPSGCGPAPFPALLWEFTDSIGNSQLDEDRNGFADLGQTWAAPTIGRVRVIEAGKVVDKYVAFFSGGMDADSKALPRRGNYLYLVDVETGKVIYKRALQGATPAEPAVVDRDSDGVLDTVYVATTAGLVYKVDLSTPVALQTHIITKTQALPNLAADTVVQRILDARWDPFPIFDTIDRPIYYAITALYISKLNTVALAFGTGDREDLWDFTGNQEGRFYLIVDEFFTAAQAASGALPRDESFYAAVRPDDLKTSKDYVLNPDPGKGRGWFLRLEVNERVITPAFGLVGFLTFSSYEPQVTVSGGSGSAVCGRTGLSRVYVVFGSNANGVLRGLTAGATKRYSEVPVFLAPPTIDSGPTQNRPRTGPGGSGGTNDPDGDGIEDTLSLDQKEIMEELKKYFPEGTRFGNYWYDVSAMGSDTRYVGIAAIPIGIVQKNWKEN